MDQGWMREKRSGTETKAGKQRYFHGRTLALTLSLCLIFTMTPLAAGTAAVPEASAASGGYGFRDMPDNWAAESLKRAVDNGLLTGFNEPGGGKTIRPDASLTRAQLAAIVNRAFGSKNTSVLSGVTDVPHNEWYAPEMAKAVKMGTFKLDTRMRPADPITRQEAFTVLARAFALTGNNTLYQFKDNGSVASWARESMGAMVASGYLTGDNGSLRPLSNITRAEFAKVMDRMIVSYVKETGAVTKGDISGNVMINLSGTTLKNTTVRGNLIIGDGVGDGNVSLDNVKVTGSLMLRGGGRNSIDIGGGSRIQNVRAIKEEGNLRIYSYGSSTLENVYLTEGRNEVILEGSFGTAYINGASSVTFRRASGSVVQNETASVRVESGSLLKSLDAAKASRAILTVEKGATISSLTVGANGRIENKGVITKAHFTGNGVTYSGNEPDSVTAASGISVPVGTVLTAAGIAAKITSLSQPARNATSLSLPSVPSGYTVFISSSSNTGVISLSGTIVPPVHETTVALTLTVKNWNNSSDRADTRSIKVTVPAKEEKKDKFAVTFGVVGAKETGTLSASIDSGVSINSGYHVEKGKTVSFKAVPADGYKVKRWLIDGTESEALKDVTAYTHTISKAVKVEAEFEKAPEVFYTVSFELTGVPTGGSITATAGGKTLVSGESVKKGTDVTFTVTPEPGYRVKSWTGAPGGTGSAVTVSSLKENLAVKVELEAVPDPAP